MTVAEVLAALSTYPADALACIPTSPDGEYADVAKVEAAMIRDTREPVALLLYAGASPPRADM